MIFATKPFSSWRPSRSSGTASSAAIPHEAFLKAHKEGVISVMVFPSTYSMYHLKYNTLGSGKMSRGSDRAGVSKTANLVVSAGNA